MAVTVTAIYDNRVGVPRGWFARRYDPDTNTVDEEVLNVRRRDGYAKAQVLAAEWAGLLDATAVRVMDMDGSPIP